MCDAPRRRSSDIAGYTASPKEARDFQRNGFSESLINCRALNVYPIIADTHFR